MLRTCQRRSELELKSPFPLLDCGLDKAALVGRKRLLVLRTPGEEIVDWMAVPSVVAHGLAVT